MERYSRCKLSVLSGHRMEPEIGTLIAMPTRQLDHLNGLQGKQVEISQKANIPHRALLQAAKKIFLVSVCELAPMQPLSV